MKEPSVLLMETEHSSKTLETIYLTTLSQIPEDSDIHDHGLKKFKSLKSAST
jgi:hypothetical protein